MEQEQTHHDTKHVNIHKSWDLNFWCEELNLRSDELKEIVKKVGPDISEIRLYLAKKLLNSWGTIY